MNKNLPAVEGNFNVVYKPGEIEIVGFEDIKKQMEQKLEKFKTLITEDGVKDAKKDAASLNKLAKAIDDKRKEIKREYEKPLKEFENKMKELVSIVKDTRESIVTQVSKYEENRKEEIGKIINEYVNTLYELHNIPNEFRTLDVKKYVKLSAVTQSGNVAKQTATEIESDIKDILIAIKEKEEEEARRQAEIERIKREAIEEYKTKEIDEEVEKVTEEVVNKVEEKVDKKEKIKSTYIATLTFEVIGSPGKSDDEVVEAIIKLLKAEKVKPLRTVVKEI